MINRRTVIGGLAASASLPLIGAGPAQKRGGILRVAADFQPTNLDPVAGTQGGDFRFLYPLYQALVDWDPDTLKLIPGLATKWTYTDPQTLVIDLRLGVLFHDGSRFDAAAAKFNLDRSKTDPRSNIKGDLASVDSVQVNGPLQITLKLNRNDAALPAVLAERAGMMASPAAIQKFGPDFARNPVGTGPWKFSVWRDNDILSVRRNDNFWQTGRPYLDGIDFKIIADTNIGLRSVIAGENDLVTSLSSTSKAIIDQQPGLGSSFASSQAMFPIWINWARKPFDDVRVRQALNYAIDRNGFNKATEAGLNEIANGILPKEHWAYDPTIQSRYPYDPAKARQLLTAAGLGSGFQMSMMGPTDERSRQRQQVVIAQLAQVGIKVNLQGFSVNDSIKAFFVDKSGDALLILWGGRIDPTQTFRAIFSKDSFYNPARTEPDGFGAALAASEASQDLSVRVKALSKVQHIVSDNALMVPLVFDSDYVAYSKKVKGYRSNLVGRPRYDTVSIDS